jgi:hypothetical protein
VALPLRHLFASDRYRRLILATLITANCDLVKAAIFIKQYLQFQVGNFMKTASFKAAIDYVADMGGGNPMFGLGLITEKTYGVCSNKKT